MPQSPETPSVNYRILDTPLGPIRIVGRDRAIAQVSFIGGTPASEPVPAGAVEGGPVVDVAAAQLEGYLAGERRGFDVPLAPEGTAHDREVWHHLQSIPYGTTTTYGAIARAMHRPGAARAVGMANNRNPIAIMIPCHRVVGADGKLTGYAAGVGIKARLLDLEQFGTVPSA